MCGPFKSPKAILRLLEIIFSTLAFITVISRGRMVSPWGIWCEFVWVFCIVVPVVLLVMEIMKLNVLLSAILPDWDDLSCGLTLLCAAMITSATIIFGAVFLCLECVGSILGFIFSLVAAVIFWVDGVMQKMKCPKGYFSTVRGILRKLEAFIGCIILAAASDFLRSMSWTVHLSWTVFCIIIFFVCLLVTVIIMVIHLLKLLRALIPFGLNKLELVFDILAAVLYVLAIIVWCVYAYKLYHIGESYYGCRKCVKADLNTVTLGAIINFVLYIVDLVLAFKDR
ncbi:myeloid-associated differentiation marker-like protein 2 [Mugil cephalus]|uniref:myeloid-associated differentiation marker-like protein 2 n=1 Tax=Mugil cephalus TaxID=48193 RepID=UPI001FB857A7|nr:myeloid-associated differentiation marker-like protein 2 [Mugil cephalus]